MPGLERVLFPRDLAEALGWLAATELAAVPLAGGTSLARKAPPGARTIVDLSRLGLDAITPVDTGVTLGAMARVQAVADSPHLDRVAGGLLRVAAGHVGSRLVRNAVTVGGNVVQVYPWSDLPVALLALDATAATEGLRPRTLSLETLLASHPRQVLDRGELVVSFHVPFAPPGTTRGGAFLSFTRTKVDDALVTVAATLTFDAAAEVVAARVVAGAIRPRPVRLAAAEAALVGGPTTAARIAQAAADAVAECVPTNDPRASVSYRSTLLGVLVRRALEACAAGARPEGGPHGV